MTAENFCYWLQGWFELLDAGEHPIEQLNKKQVKVLREHLGLVFAGKLQEDRGDGFIDVEAFRKAWEHVAPCDEAGDR